MVAFPNQTNVTTIGAISFNHRKQLRIESNSININSNLFQDLSAKESELISGGMTLSSVEASDFELCLEVLVLLLESSIELQKMGLVLSPIANPPEWHPNA